MDDARVFAGGRLDATDRTVDESPLSRRHFRSIWISDFHLGTARCKAESLRNFLRRHSAENLFMVGDVIDGWNVGPGWCWDAAQTAVVEELWAWRRRGTRIIVMPGNHDERNTDMVRTLFGAVECHEDFIHRTAEGRRMLITHGHQFDGGFHNGWWMTLIGSVGYSAAMRVNLWYNREGIASRRGAARAILRRRLKAAVHYLVDFRDEQVTRAARHRKVDGVICGHTHKPDHRMIGPILYINDGDWVQSRTALVEEMSGVLRLLRWDGTETDVKVTR
ncbi:MAG TPA: UDP-2,3-diacylglucosamine diphosphatase [Candidatus Binataceae bacterium]|nr:UDP-2,3-diacylglucosamine diphosphatase [Candidatus Binataceae bacterium]